MAPVILLLLMGLVQFALIFETQIGIENAVREAARETAALDVPDVTTAQTNATWALSRVQTLLGNVQNHNSSNDTLEVCIYTPATYTQDPSNQNQVMVRIKETYKHPVFMPIVNLIIDPIDGVTDQSLHVSTSSTFRVESTQTTQANIGTGAYARNTSDTSACAT